MDLLNPTPTLRPSAEMILAETEKGRRTDSPERVNQSIPTVSQPTGTRNAQKNPTRSRNCQIIPTRTKNAHKFSTGSGNIQMTHAGAGNSQRIPTQNSVINPTETGYSVINPTGSVGVRSPTGTRNPTGNSTGNPTGNSTRNSTGNPTGNPTGSVQIRSPTGNGNAQQSCKVKSYFWGKKKEVKFSGKCLLPGEKYSSKTEKVKISEKYDPEQTRFREYSV